MSTETKTRSTAHLTAVMLLVLGAIAGCNPSKYLTTVVGYADASAAGTETLRGASQAAGDICRKRAAARFLKRHLLKTPDAPALPLWIDYYVNTTGVDEAKGADDSLSWDAYCKSVATSGHNFVKLLALIDGYSLAMKSLASQAWDGKTVKDTVDGLATLSGGDSSIGGAVLSKLAEPAKALAAAIVSKYAEGATYDLAIAANGPLQALLDGLKSYVEALKRTVVEPTIKELRETVGLLESKAGPWREAPFRTADTVAFVNYATSTDRDMEDLQTLLVSYDAVLRDLKAAHQALVDHRPQDASTSEMAGILTTLLTTAANARAAANKVAK